MSYWANTWQEVTSHDQRQEASSGNDQEGEEPLGKLATRWPLAVGGNTPANPVKHSLDQEAGHGKEELVRPVVVVGGGGDHEGRDGGVDGHGLAKHHDRHKDVDPGPGHHMGVVPHSPHCLVSIGVVLIELGGGHVEDGRDHDQQGGQGAHDAHDTNHPDWQGDCWWWRELANYNDNDYYLPNMIILMIAGKIPPNPIPSFALPMYDGGNLPRLPRKLVWKTKYWNFTKVKDEKLTNLSNGVNTAVDGVDDKHDDEEEILILIRVDADKEGDDNEADDHSNGTDQ